MRRQETIPQLLEDEIRRAIAGGVPRAAKLERRADAFKRAAHFIGTFLCLVPLVSEAFISYRRRGESELVAGYLGACLSRLGIKVLRDIEMINAGDSIRSFINAATSRGRWFVLVLSRRYFESYWCMIELEAIMKEPRLRQRILPIAAEDSMEDLLSTTFRAYVIRYWEEQAARIETAFASLKSPTTNLRNERDAYLRFCAHLDEWMGVLADKSWFSSESGLTKAVLARE